jgi:hypothetical protein
MRVKGPNEADWAKLVRLMKYLNGTRELKLTLSADNLHCIKWYVDASFAVHPNYKSHTGATMSYGDGDGAVQSISRKQKLNTKSSTESELVGYDPMDKAVPRGTRIRHQQQHIVPRQQECYFIGNQGQEKLWEENPSIEHTLLLPHRSS